MMLWEVPSCASRPEPQHVISDVVCSSHAATGKSRAIAGQVAILGPAPVIPEAEVVGLDVAEVHVGVVKDPDPSVRRQIPVAMVTERHVHHGVSGVPPAAHVCGADPVGLSLDRHPDICVVVEHLDVALDVRVEDGEVDV